MDEYRRRNREHLVSTPCAGEVWNRIFSPSRDAIANSSSVVAFRNGISPPPFSRQISKHSSNKAILFAVNLFFSLSLSRFFNDAPFTKLRARYTAIIDLVSSFIAAILRIRFSSLFFFSHQCDTCFFLKWEFFRRIGVEWFKYNCSFDLEMNEFVRVMVMAVPLVF